MTYDPRPPDACGDRVRHLPVHPLVCRSSPIACDRMSDRQDIVVTWPRKKPLADYLAELERAVRFGQVINYRVAVLPNWATQEAKDKARCFMVHDGFIRGWCKILDTTYRVDGEVDGWPAGFYIVRSPIWNPVPRTPMRGFQGYRWYRGGAS